MFPRQRVVPVYPMLLFRLTSNDRCRSRESRNRKGCNRDPEFITVIETTPDHFLAGAKVPFREPMAKSAPKLQERPRVQPVQFARPATSRSLQYLVEEGTSCF